MNKTKSRGWGKKAFVLTLDAFLAASILIAGIILLSQFSANEPVRESIQFTTSDILNALSELKMSDLDASRFAYYESKSNYTNQNLTIIEQIAIYWAANETSTAGNLTEDFVSDLVDERTGIEIVLGSQSLYLKNAPSQTDVFASDRMITGVLEGAPLTGSTSSAYLRKITDKRTSSFAYFGGFIGQGNVTVFLDEYPAGIANSEITKMTLELDIPKSFKFYINGVQCANLTPSASNMQPTMWDLTKCNSSISSTNRNNISIIFNTTINQSYVAGGYFKIDYKSAELQENLSTGKKKYYFPQVDGIVNLYDSFYIPGTLQNMTIYLHYKSNSKTYLTVGSAIVYQHNASGDTSTTLTDTNLTAFPVNLNYNSLSNKTVPLRFASYNETYDYIFGTNSDVVLITDLSGSMKYRMNSWNNPGNSIPNCRASDLSDPNSRRLGVAACLDSDINAIIMNTSIGNNSNRLFLVDFSDNANPFYSANLNLITKTNVDNEITTRYKSKSQNEIQGGTCICCAINQAYDILNAYSNNNRTKSVIVMTDGVPTACCGRYMQGGSWQCNATATGTTGVWTSSTCTGDVADCSGNDCNGPIDAAINAARRVYDDLNATVYGVGFGPIDTCTNANFTVRQIAAKGNGSYIVSGSGLALQSFYRNISYEILEKVAQSSQFVSSQGNVTSSVLYGDSYIEFDYGAVVDAPEPNEISVSVQTAQFGSCNPSIVIPAGIRVADSKIVSYSGIHWTDAVLIDGTEVYNLSKYSSDYTTVGDPYEVQIPANLLTAGTRSILITTGDSPNNYSGCSLNNTLIYTALVPSTTSRSDVVEKTDGCTWTIQFEDDTTNEKTIPSSYTGPNRCSYTATNYTLSQGAYDNTDAYDIAVHNLLVTLDFDNNGKVFVNLDAEDIEIVITTISSVPYLWGPSTVIAKVWQ